jgi:hypothetical protein
MTLLRQYQPNFIKINVTKVGTGCKEAGKKIMLVTFLVIYNIYSCGVGASFFHDI